MLNRMMASWFRRNRWIFTGPIPKRLDKAIIVAGPHMSNEDIKLAAGVMVLSGYRPRILVDQKAFGLFRNKILKTYGALAVDESNPESVKALVKQQFAEHESISVVFTPIRSGKKQGGLGEMYYDLSLELKLPIVLVGIDRRRKQVKFHSHFFPSIDRERDLNFIRRFFGTFELDS